MELLNEVRFFETIENLQLEECIYPRKYKKKILVLQVVIIFSRNFSASSHLVC